MYKIKNITIPKKILVIGEIGINHNGSLKLAKQLIKGAKKAGCEIVKFQKRTINIVYKEEFLNEKRESPWGNTQRDQKNGLEFGFDEYSKIDEYCKKIGIQWFASAWDLESLNFLKKFKLKYNKIASPLLTKLDFVEEVAKQKKHTFISTWMSTYNYIFKVINIFKKKKCKFTLLHCVSEYPCEDHKLNLINLTYLKNKYKCNIGYSGHEASLTPSIIAAMLGSEVIERHITLDRNMYGSDQKSSLSLDGFGRLIEMLNKIKITLGKKKNFVTAIEKVNSRKLRYWD